MKKTYISPELDIFSFELTDAQATSVDPSPSPTAKPISEKHSLIGMTAGYEDTPHEGFYHDETLFQ